MSPAQIAIVVAVDDVAVLVDGDQTASPSRAMPAWKRLGDPAATRRVVAPQGSVDVATVGAGVDHTTCAPARTTRRR
jgi:hypothetical protein